MGNEIAGKEGEREEGNELAGKEKEMKKGEKGVED